MRPRPKWYRLSWKVLNVHSPILVIWSPRQREEHLNGHQLLGWKIDAERTERQLKRGESWTSNSLSTIEFTHVKKKKKPELDRVGQSSAAFSRGEMPHLNLLCGSLEAFARLFVEKISTHWKATAPDRPTETEKRGVATNNHSTSCPNISTFTMNSIYHSDNCGFK